VSRRQLRWTLAIAAISIEVGLALWFYVLRPRLCRDHRARS
jgi:hypothetical protein